MSRKKKHELEQEMSAEPAPKPRLRRKPRGGHARAYHRRRTTRVVYGIGLCMIIAALAHVSHGFFEDVPYFKLNHLKIEGLKNPQLEAEVRGLVEHAVEQNKNILSLDSTQLAEMIGAHPRIRNLKLEKLYPDTLIVSASEREPVSILSSDGFYLVDSESYVIESLKPTQLRKYDFPYITGVPQEDIEVGKKVLNPGLYKALDLIRVTRERNTEFYAHLSEINIGSDPTSHLDNVVAHMKGGMQVRFGEKNPLDQLPAFDVYVEMMEKQNVDPYDMHFVDLRFKDQVVYMDEPTALAAQAGLLDKFAAKSAPDLKESNSNAGKTKVKRAGITDKISEEAARRSAGTESSITSNQRNTETEVSHGSRPAPPSQIETASQPDPLGSLPRPSVVR